MTGVPAEHGGKPLWWFSLAAFAPPSPDAHLPAVFASGKHLESIDAEFKELYAAISVMDANSGVVLASFSFLGNRSSYPEPCWSEDGKFATCCGSLINIAERSITSFSGGRCILSPSFDSQSTLLAFSACPDYDEAVDSEPEWTCDAIVMSLQSGDVKLSIPEMRLESLSTSGNFAVTVKYQGPTPERRSPCEYQVWDVQRRQKLLFFDLGHAFDSGFMLSDRFWVTRQVDPTQNHSRVHIICVDVEGKDSTVHPVHDLGPGEAWQPSPDECKFAIAGAAWLLAESVDVVLRWAL